MVKGLFHGRVDEDWMGMETAAHLLSALILVFGDLVRAAGCSWSFEVLVAIVAAMLDGLGVDDGVR